MGQSIRKFTEFPLQNQPALGTRVICDIPLTADLETLQLLLTGTVTLSTGASALVSDGIANLITSIELIGDGRDSILSMPWNMAQNANMFRRKFGVFSSVTQPGVTAAAHPYEATVSLDLSSFGTIRPKDSALRENKYKTLQLHVRLAGDWTGVFTGGGFVVSANTFSLVVAGDEVIELADATGNASAPIMQPLVSSRDMIVAGATTRERFRLTPDQALRGIALRTVTAAGALSDVFLSRVRVYVGKDLRLDFAAETIKERFKNNGDTAQTGYYFLDFADAKFGGDRLNDALDLRLAVTRGADAYLEIDTLIAGTATVVQYGLTNP